MNALSSPLHGRHGYKRYSVASSSISSFSAHSSDEERAPRKSLDGQSACSDDRTRASEYSSKSAPGYGGLPLARRPSGANHRNAVPHLSHRDSSGQWPMSSPDEEYGPISSPRHRRGNPASYGPISAGKPRDSKRNSSVATSAFALLSLNQAPSKKSPTSASGSSRNSPSTPKLPLRSANASSSGDALTSSIIYTGAAVDATPRVSARRPRDDYQDQQGYRSPSPGHRFGPSLLRQTRPHGAPVETNIQSAPPGVVSRGRSRARRVDTSSSPEEEDGRRGRYTSQEILPSPAPGYGEGRSGIKQREKDKSRRSVYA